MLIKTKISLHPSKLVHEKLEATLGSYPGIEIPKRSSSSVSWIDIQWLVIISSLVVKCRELFFPNVHFTSNFEAVGNLYV